MVWIVQYRVSGGRPFEGTRAGAIAGIITGAVPHTLTRMVRDSGFSAIGARLEARLHAHDMRIKSVETSAKPENIADATAQFVLPDVLKSVAAAATATAKTEPEMSMPSLSADHGVGATFRRKGMLSDVPMPVTRVGEGVVFTTFTDPQGSQEMAFDPTQIELVTKAPALAQPNEGQFFPSLNDRVKFTAPVAVLSAPDIATMPDAAVAPVLSASEKAAETAISPALSTSVKAENSARTLVPTPSAKAAETALPLGAVRLPDGTLQFGYAPTGGLINRVPNKPEPAPPEFGVGATVRMKGVLSDAPMTVTQVGDGFISATRTDSTGTHVMEFPFNQFDLVTAAP